MAGEKPPDPGAAGETNRDYPGAGGKLDRAQHLLDRMAESLGRINAAAERMQSNNQQIDRAIKILKQRREQGREQIAGVDQQRTPEADVQPQPIDRSEPSRSAEADVRNQRGDQEPEVQTRGRVQRESKFPELDFDLER